MGIGLGEALLAGQIGASALGALGGEGPDLFPSGRFKELRDLAQPLAFGMVPQIQQQLGPGSEFAQGLQGGAMNIFGNLQGAGQQLSPFVGAGFTGAQIGQLGQDLGQFFNQQLLPGLTQGATGAGGTGLGRLGVAQGVAAQGALDAFSSGVTDILQRDLFRRQDAATQMGQQSILGGQAGLSGLPNIFNAGLAPFLASFAPLEAFQQTLTQGVPVAQTNPFQAVAQGLNLGVTI